MGPQRTGLRREQELGQELGPLPGLQRRQPSHHQNRRHLLSHVSFFLVVLETLKQTHQSGS